MSVFKKGGELYPGKDLDALLLIVHKIENHKRIAKDLQIQQRSKQAKKHRDIAEIYLNTLVRQFEVLKSCKKTNRLPVFYGISLTKQDKELLKEKQLYQLEQIQIYLNKIQEI